MILRYQNTLKMRQLIAHEQVRTNVLWGDNTVAPMSGGFVQNLSQQIIFSPVQAGVMSYNHHVRMCVVGSRIYMHRSTHDYREDGGGQWSLYTYSDDVGQTWTEWQTLVARGSDVYNQNPIVNGVTIWPHYIFTIGTKAISINYIADRDNSWGNQLAVEIENGEIVDKYYLLDNGSQPVTGVYPVYAYNASKAQIVMNELAKTENAPWYSPLTFGYPRPTSLSMEYSGLRLPNGYEFLLYRELGNGRFDKEMFWRENAQDEWNGPTHEPIPDCISGSTTIWKLYGDYVYLSGNDAAPGGGYRTNYWISKSKYWELNFETAYEIVRGMLPDIQFAGTNKNGGYSYCDFVKVNNKIVHAGSRGKEDIYVHVFDDI